MDFERNMVNMAEILRNYRPDDHAFHDHVFNLLKREIENNGKAEVDLAGVRTITPSIAYNGFAKLMDVFGAEVQKKICFINDQRQLSKAVWAAFERRNRIIKSMTSK